MGIEHRIVLPSQIFKEGYMVQQITEWQDKTYLLLLN